MFLKNVTQHLNAPTFKIICGCISYIKLGSKNMFQIVCLSSESSEVYKGKWLGNRLFSLILLQGTWSSMSLVSSHFLWTEDHLYIELIRITSSFLCRFDQFLFKGPSSAWLEFIYCIGRPSLTRHSDWCASNGAQSFQVVDPSKIEDIADW